MGYALAPQLWATQASHRRWSDTMQHRVDGCTSGRRRSSRRVSGSGRAPKEALVRAQLLQFAHATSRTGLSRCALGRSGRFRLTPAASNVLTEFQAHEHPEFPVVERGRIGSPLYMYDHQMSTRGPGPGLLP